MRTRPASLCKQGDSSYVWLTCKSLAVSMQLKVKGAAAGTLHCVVCEFFFFFPFHDQSYKLILIKFPFRITSTNAPEI